KMEVPVRSHLTLLTDDQVSRIRARWEREKRARAERAAQAAAPKPTRRRKAAPAPEPTPAPAPVEAAPHAVRRRARPSEAPAAAVAEPTAETARPAVEQAPPVEAPTVVQEAAPDELLAEREGAARETTEHPAAPGAEPRTEAPVETDRAVAMPVAHEPETAP